MNIMRLKTDEGVGYPLRLDQLVAVQDSLIAAISRLCTDALAAFGDDDHGLLLSGSIEITGSNRDLYTTECVIAWRDKLYYLPDTAMSGGYGPYTAYALVPSTQTSMPLLYKDGNVRDTLITDTMDVVMYNGYGDPLPANSLSISNVHKFSELYLRNIAKTWLNASMLNDWESIIGDPIRYRRNNIGQLELRGSFRLASGGNQTLPIINLPAGYRPSTNRYIMAASKDSATDPTDAPIMIVLSPNGDLGSLSPYDNVSGIYRLCHIIPL